jgi:hypothetical protein
VEGDVPEDVRQFVSRNIQSLEQLEVLLLISALPDRDWTVDAVYQVVQTNRALVEKRMNEVADSRFLIRTPEGAFRYAPESESIARQVANTAGFYKLSRHKIVELIYSSPPDDILKFSNAFRFKKPE